jgi:hypothetical protein
MQSAEARKLREQWAASGNNWCDHPAFEEEYSLGVQTGDYICIKCGEAFSREERNDFEAARKKLES